MCVFAFIGGERGDELVEGDIGDCAAAACRGDEGKCKSKWLPISVSFFWMWGAPGRVVEER